LSWESRVEHGGGPATQLRPRLLSAHPIPQVLLDHPGRHTFAVTEARAVMAPHAPCELILLLSPFELDAWLYSRGSRDGTALAGCRLRRSFTASASAERWHRERSALGSNICRCTGYVKIVEAVKYAAELHTRGHAATQRRRIALLHEPPVANHNGLSGQRI
jgi:hypothetical protein